MYCTCRAVIKGCNTGPSRLSSVDVTGVASHHCTLCSQLSCKLLQVHIHRLRLIKNLMTALTCTCTNCSLAYKNKTTSGLHIEIKLAILCSLCFSFTYMCTFFLQKLHVLFLTISWMILYLQKVSTVRYLPEVMELSSKVMTSQNCFFLKLWVLFDRLEQPT